MTISRTTVKTLAAAIALAGGALLMSGSANALTLPTCVQPQNCLQYGDFDIYSMGYLNFYDTGSTSKPNGTIYDIHSSPGQIKDLTVLGTGSGGQDVTTNVPGSIDGAYETPGGNGNGNTVDFMSTGTTADPGPNPFAPEFNGDTANTWDTRISTLQGLLGSGTLQFYFNFNEGNANLTNGKGGTQLSAAGLPDQDLLVWAQVTLGKDNSSDTVSFTLDGHNPIQALQDQTLFNFTGDDGENKDYGHVYGQICVDDTANAADRALIHLGACDGTESGNPKTISQDLGSDRTAFIAQNDALSNAFWNGGYDFMQVDFRLGEITSGYEQIYLLASGSNVPVPEPATLGLFGVGLLGLGFAGYQRRRKA